MQDPRRRPGGDDHRQRQPLGRGMQVPGPQPGPRRIRDRGRRRAVLWVAGDRAGPGQLGQGHTTIRLRDHAITPELYDQQITDRCPYHLKHKEGPDADGYQRLSCPATGTRPRLICPLRQASPTPRQRDGRAKVLQPPPEPPRICRQTSITIAPDLSARYRQDLPYGSLAWHKSYATLRNTIEGLNGLIKDPAHEALAQPARRRVRGPVHLHRAAPDGREHPQDRRLAGPHHQRQDRHHPAGTPTPRQPARLPPRPLTARSTHRRNRPASPVAAMPQPPERCNPPASVR